MFNKIILTIAAITIFTAVPSLAATGCNKIKFFGSYTSPQLNDDVFGDGSAIHSFAFQLTLQSDGTANQYWTGLPDYIMNLGTGSAQIGSWTCRSDGKLVV